MHSPMSSRRARFSEYRVRSSKPSAATQRNAVFFFFFLHLLARLGIALQDVREMEHVLDEYLSVRARM